ncbi:MAG: ATP-binding cassette domain-containing protein [Rhodothermales bacterium]
MHTLDVQGVRKQYDTVLAVDNVSFKAEPGRILGLLGPNGAGKSSTIRMITYITIPDEGRILFGNEPVSPRTQAIMGYLPEERGLYPKMKVAEQLVYFGELKGLSRADAKRKAAYWLDRFGARDWVNKPTSDLSKGMQQKIQFIATILHDPKLLILDEPFGGLDPINADLLQSIIMELKDDGRTILFASHRMEQVEQLCDDICLVSKGQIVLSGPLNEVKRRFGRNTVEIDFEGTPDFVDALHGVRVTQRSSRHVQLQLGEGSDPAAILQAAIAGTDELIRFERMELPMREIFVKAVTEEQGAAAAAEAGADVQTVGGAK